MNILVEPPRSAWDLNWSMLRIPIRIHPLFWLMALFLSYFEKLRFEYVLIGMAAIFFSILIHEFGHALSGIYYGDRHPRVVLYQMGGLCIGGDAELRRWPKISMILWGPGAGFILGGIAYGLKWATDHGHIGFEKHFAFALYDLIWINIVWGALNLLPLFPLDGGQIARELITWKLPRFGERLAFTISMYTGIILAIAGVGFYIYMEAKDPRSLMPTVFFAVLAHGSWKLRKQIDEYGSLGGEEDRRPREPWEQDADWWKR